MAYIRISLSHSIHHIVSLPVVAHLALLKKPMKSEDKVTAHTSTPVNKPDFALSGY